MNDVQILENTVNDVLVLKNTVNDVQALEHSCNSDHNVLVWKLICDVGLTKNKKPTYHRADYELMRGWLTNINWNKECEELAVEDMWAKFCSSYNQAIDPFVPLGHIKNKKNLAG